MKTKSFLKSLSRTFSSIKEQFSQFHNTKVNTESRLLILKNSKEKAGISNFLSLDTTAHSRSLLAKLRLGVLPLQLEKGRRVGVDRLERSCLLCKSGAVEDEAHFIFDCPPFKACRETFMSKLVNLIPFLNHMNSPAKLRYLYYSEKTPPKVLYFASRLLSDVWHARSTLLSLLQTIEKILG